MCKKAEDKYNWPFLQQREAFEAFHTDWLPEKKRQEFGLKLTSIRKPDEDFILYKKGFRSSSADSGKCFK